MNEENLKERLAYFQQRLEEAKRRHSAKEPHPRNFDAGYTTDTFKTWRESIALINERLAIINESIKNIESAIHSSSRSPGNKPVIRIATNKINVAHASYTSEATPTRLY